MTAWKTIITRCKTALRKIRERRLEEIWGLR